MQKINKNTRMIECVEQDSSWDIIRLLLILYLCNLMVECFHTLYLYKLRGGMT